MSMWANASWLEWAVIIFMALGFLIDYIQRKS
jgi:hypothetical protein